MSDVERTRGIGDPDRLPYKDFPLRKKIFYWPFALYMRIVFMGPHQNWEDIGIPDPFKPYKLQPPPYNRREAWKNWPLPYVPPPDTI
jgi:hypothetical protein